MRARRAALRRYAAVTQQAARWRRVGAVGRRRRCARLYGSQKRLGPASTKRHALQERAPGAGRGMEAGHAPWDPAQFAWNPEAMVRPLTRCVHVGVVGNVLRFWLLCPRARAKASERQVATSLASAPPDMTAKVALSGAAAGGASTSANRGAQPAQPPRPQAVCQIPGCGAALDDGRSNGYNLRTKLWCVQKHCSPWSRERATKLYTRTVAVSCRTLRNIAPTGIPELTACSSGPQHGPHARSCTSHRSSWRRGVHRARSHAVLPKVRK